MTIQVGVPGNAGGTSGGLSATEITQAGGRVTVEADGSITIKPVDGQNIIFVRGEANNNAPLFEFDDDSGSPNGYVGAEGPNAGDHLDDASLQAMIVAGQSVFIGIIGQISTFDITGSGLEFKGPRWLHTNVNNSAWGQAFAFADIQFDFNGNFPGVGDGEPKKFRIGGRVDGEDGDTDGQFGLDVGVDFQTQTGSETIDKIAQAIFRGPAITNNLGGGGVITDGAAVLIEGPSSGALNNYALLVESGLTQLQQMFVPDIGPHTWGRDFISGFVQYRFGGDFVDFNSSNPKKFLIDGRITGSAGAQNYSGFESAGGFITQVATEQISAMWGSSFVPPSITDNLTGGATIEEAATVRISNAPSGADAVWALLVQAGLTELFNLEHAGTLLGFYSTAGVVQPTGVAVSSAGIHAALVTLGLITA